MKMKFFLLLILLLGMGELYSQNNIALNKDVRFDKIIKSLNNWDMKSAVGELLEISKSTNPADEGFFYFFKASITLNTYIQVDSTQDNNALSYVDSSVKYFERAIITGTTIDFPELYIQNPQQGLDTCAGIIGKRAMQYFISDDPLKAMSHYEKIIDFKPDAPNLLNAALTAMRLTSYKKAEIYFKQSLALDPKNEKAWIGLTETYKRINDTLNAIQTVNNSMQYDSLNRDLLINLYNIAIFSNNQTLIDHTIRRLTVANSTSDYALLLGNLLVTKRDFLKAEPYYLSIKDNEETKCYVLIRFYYNWYLKLYATNLLENLKGNSHTYCSNVVSNEHFIKEKLKKCLTKESTNVQIKAIIDFLNNEFNK